ncbi:MAG: hypothetical protein IT381_08165 [Deltaproteobacteria bacterium]|nr:hypothetical protein [Deltaproteobacteria bacterium]
MKDWRFHLGFGPQIETYAPTDFTIRSPAIDATFKNTRFNPRPLMNMYALWNRQPKDWIRFVDEPTNHFFFETRYKEQWAFGVEVFHPKIVLGSDSEGPANHDVHAKGRIGDEKVDHRVDLNETFELLQLTKGLMSYGLFADRIQPIVSGRAGALNLRLGAGASLYTGFARAIYKDPHTGERKDEENKLSVIGGNIMLRSAIEYVVPGGHVTVRANFDATFGGLDYALMGGRATQAVQALRGGLSLSAGF